MATPLEATFREDLFKPVFGAAWMGLFLTALEGTFSKKARLMIFALIVGAGVMYLAAKRAQGDE